MHDAEKLYRVGPQDDGSVVIRVPDEWHRLLLSKAVEKQKKNATSAEGTISALADGGDPFLSRIQTALERLLELVNSARAPSEQLSGTPMGKAIAEAQAGSDGITWAVGVPEPRPQAGDLVRWPTGQAESIIKVIGYSSEQEAFMAKSEETDFGGLVAHGVPGATRPEWRLLSMLLEYPEDTAASDVLDDFGAGVDQSLPLTQEREDAIADAAAKLAKDAGASPAEAAAAGADAVETARSVAAANNGAAPKKGKKGKKAAAHPGAVAEGPKVSQRERNAAANGVAGRAVRPVPKPSAKKGAAKKGGK